VYSVGYCLLRNCQDCDYFFESGNTGSDIIAIGRFQEVDFVDLSLHLPSLEDASISERIQDGKERGSSPLRTKNVAVVSTYHKVMDLSLLIITVKAVSPMQLRSPHVVISTIPQGRKREYDPVYKLFEAYYRRAKFII